MNSFTTPANADGWKLQSMLGCTVTTDDAAERSALQLLKYTQIHKQRKIAETNPMIENNLKFFYERQNAETLLPFFSFVPFFPSLSLFVAYILHIHRTMLVDHCLRVVRRWRWCVDVVWRWWRGLVLVRLLVRWWMVSNICLCFFWNISVLSAE